MLIFIPTVLAITEATVATVSVIANFIAIIIVVIAKATVTAVSAVANATFVAISILIVVRATLNVPSTNTAVTTTTTRGGECTGSRRVRVTCGGRST